MKSSKMKKLDIHRKRAFTIQEAAEYACVSRATVDNWLARGDLAFEELPSTGKGKYKFRRIRKSDLDAFLERFYMKTTKNISDKTSHSKLILLPRKS